MVNSLAVTHLERHWSLAHYPVFCLFCALSSYVVTFLLLLFIPPNLTVFLPPSISPLIKKLDGRDVSLSPSLSLTFAGFMFFSISLPGKESHKSHARSWTRSIAVFNLVIFSQEFYCFSTSIWLKFTSSLWGFTQLIFHYPSSADALEDIGATYFSKFGMLPYCKNTEAKQEKSVLLFRANPWWKWAVWDRIWGHLSSSLC